MIGKCIAHYRVEKKLGEGGMGEVYLAEDTVLGRKVALKLLPAEMAGDTLARKRFHREARSAAALDQPFICKIYETGETEDGHDFIAMEYVEGRTLRERLEEGPLSTGEAIRISAEIAEALEMAHLKGIVHRDLKPANIMLTPQGHAKVMDFGLAKRLETHGRTDQDLTSGLTREGATLGTPAYMSPEQIKAQQADHRSDIFSFGIIFYEMLTGVHPFRRPGPAETMGAILYEKPEPLAENRTLSTELLQETVSRMLAKIPDERIQTVKEVANRLAQLSADPTDPRLKGPQHERLGRRLALVLTVVAAAVLIGWWALPVKPAEVGGLVIRSIVVLPLTNVSGDPEQEYFVDGMTETLITDLSKIGALKVIARSSSMRYKGTQKPLAEIARELNVEAVIEGSVRREADQVRVTAQLIEAATERNLWADRYERNLTSILALQGEVAQAIARQIQVTLTPTEENLLTRTRQVHPEAYEAYLKGQSHWYKLTPADLETALQYFDLALEKDSDYALAQVGIALVWCGRQQMGITPPQEAGPKARAAALRAVELDATLAEAHYVLAILKTWTDWDWKGGETSFRRAIELNPNYADVRAYYSHHLLIVGRPDEAAAQMERALELDPFNPLFHALNGVVLHCGSRRYDDAIEQFRIALRSVPNHPVALWGLEDAFYEKGMYKEAFEAAMTYFVTITGDPKPLETLERSYEQEGFKGAMSRLAGLWVVHSRSSPVSFSDPMGTYAYAGDADRALEWLERGFEERDPNVPYMFLVPGYDGLRKEPRFQDLQRRMNFPQEALSGSPNQTP